MKKFSNLGVETPNRFAGDKISIYEVLNKEVEVHEFKIGPSKFADRGTGIRLDLQITVDSVKRVVWSGSTILMDQIKQLKPDDFPFTTTIVKMDSKGFKFT